MAALSGITAVRPTATTKVKLVIYGQTITAGQSVYLDATDMKWKLADSNAAIGLAEVKGIAVTPGVLDGYGYIATEGGIILVGTTMAVGSTYYVGQTVGSIVPTVDLATSDYVSRIGDSKTATEMTLAILATAIVKA